MVVVKKCAEGGNDWAVGRDRASTGHAPCPRGPGPGAIFCQKKMSDCGVVIIGNTRFGTTCELMCRTPSPDHEPMVVFTTYLYSLSTYDPIVRMSSLAYRAVAKALTILLVFRKHSVQ